MCMCMCMCLRLSVYVRVYVYVYVYVHVCVFARTVPYKSSELVLERNTQVLPHHNLDLKRVDISFVISAGLGFGAVTLQGVR